MFVPIAKLFVEITFWKVGQNANVMFYYKKNHDILNTFITN